MVARKIRPEAMTLALPETPEGAFSEKAAAPLLEKIRARRITALAAGPGLGRSPQAARFVLKLFSGLKLSPGSVRCAVLDADGFLALKSRKDKIGAPGLPVIVTPHPGELAAFLGISVARVQSRRLEIAREFAKLYAVVCVLKGHATVVADGRRAFVNPTGNPGMATGGSGDVLTGLIAALSGQVSGGALETAAAGTFLHGLAGDFAARAKTQEGMLAGDIAEFLPQALRKVFGKK
jgi:NAD(P)H-hydrate epimerase